MKIYRNPERGLWEEIIARPVFDTKELTTTVSAILDAVKERGDEALYAYGERFDKVRLNALRVTDQEFEEADALVNRELREAIAIAARNIDRFHASQSIEERRVETSPGVVCWQKAVGIDKVGIYVPGGSAPLFSTVLMLAIPARIAGCGERILCTPPNQAGKIHPAILYAARIAGITEVYKLGGVQAIGAMAYGTESVPKVYKIFGPGNQYVTMAKQLVSLREVAIDMPAGPSEVLVIADRSSNPAFVAADFLSQAEHGADSQALLFTTDEELVAPFMEQLELQLACLPRREYASKSLYNSKVVVLSSMDQLMELTDLYAPEHLIIQCADYRALSHRVRNAGSVFLGPYTPESAGDYASGTNHTLPTNGYARAYSGVNLDSFMRKITFQEISKAGLLELGPHIEVMAENEQLDAHKRAVSVRLSEIQTKNESIYSC